MLHFGEREGGGGASRCFQGFDGLIPAEGVCAPKCESMHTAV